MTIDNIKIKRAVVLMSGGVDSAVAAYTIAKDYEELWALTVNYGQITQLEWIAAGELAGNIAHGFKRLNLHNIGEIYVSPLIKGDAEPTSTPKGQKQSRFVVPLRNIILTSVASAWAETLDVEAVCIGVTKTDVEGYPDCHPTVYKHLFNAVKKGTEDNKTAPRILTPLAEMEKHEIISAGHKLGVPFDCTWSCYYDSSNGVPCGVCDSCKERAVAFKKAKLDDPLFNETSTMRTLAANLASERERRSRGH